MIIRIVLIYIKWILIAMPIQRETETSNTVRGSVSNSQKKSLIRIKSQDLFQLKREIEIDHEGPHL